MGIRRLPGNAAVQRQEISAVTGGDLWNYYHQLRDYQDQLETQKQRLQRAL